MEMRVNAQHVVISPPLVSHFNGYGIHEYLRGMISFMFVN